MCRDITAVVLSKLVTRAELSRYRGDLLEWCWEVLAPDQDDTLHRCTSSIVCITTRAALLYYAIKSAMQVIHHCRSFGHAFQHAASWKPCSDDLPCL